MLLLLLQCVAFFSERWCRWRVGECAGASAGEKRKKKKKQNKSDDSTTAAARAFLRHIRECCTAPYPLGCHSNSPACSTDTLYTGLTYEKECVCVLVGRVVNLLVRRQTERALQNPALPFFFFFEQHFTLGVQRNSAASVSRQLLVLGFQSASVLREGQDQINRDSSVLLLLLLLGSASRLEDFLGLLLLTCRVVVCCRRLSCPPSFGGGFFRLDPASPAFFSFLFLFLLRHRRRSQDKLFGFACRVDRKQLAALSRALLQFSHSVFVSPRQRIASSRSGGHPHPSLSRLCRSAETRIVHSASAVDTVRTEWPAPLSPNRRRHELGRPLTYLVAQCVFCDFDLI